MTATSTIWNQVSNQVQLLVRDKIHYSVNCRIDGTSDRLVFNRAFDGTIFLLALDIGSVFRNAKAAIRGQCIAILDDIKDGEI